MARQSDVDRLLEIVECIRSDTTDISERLKGMEGEVNALTRDIRDGSEPLPIRVTRHDEQLKTVQGKVADLVKDLAEIQSRGWQLRLAIVGAIAGPIVSAAIAALVAWVTRK